MRSVSRLVKIKNSETTLAPGSLGTHQIPAFVSWAASL